MMCYTQEEIPALVSPNSFWFVFFFFQAGERLFCSLVLRCHLGNSKLGWRQILGQGAGDWDQMQSAQEGFTGIEEHEIELCLWQSAEQGCPIPMEVLRVVCALFTCNLLGQNPENLCQKETKLLFSPRKHKCSVM